MTETLTIAGVVATPIRDITTSEGLRIASFRLAANQRRFDRSAGRWIDTETNWYTITAFRRLAEHIAASFQKGQRVLVHGRVRVRSWENGERTGTTVEIEAESAGHDLRWGDSQFSRAVIEQLESGDAPAVAPSPESSDAEVEMEDDAQKVGAGWQEN